MGIRGAIPRRVPLRRALIFLISRPFKRDISRLVWLAGWIMLMRCVDLFWMIEPNFSVTFNLTWLDIAVPIAIGGLWLAYFFRNLSLMPLVPAYDVDAQRSWNPRTGITHELQVMSDDTHIDGANQEVDFEREDLAPKPIFVFLIG